MRTPSRDSSPGRIIAVYILTTLLVLAHEVDRFSNWLEDFGSQGHSPLRILSLNLSADLRAMGQSSGLSSLGALESRALAAITPEATIGARKLKPSEFSQSANLASTNLASPNHASPNLASPFQELFPELKVLDPRAHPPTPSNRLPVSLDPSPLSSAPSSGQPNDLYSLDNKASEGAFKAGFRLSKIQSSLDSRGNLARQGSLANLKSREMAPSIDTTSPSEVIAYPLTVNYQGSVPLASPLAREDKPILGFQRVLLTGDSMMMEGIGPQLQRYLKTIENVEVSRQAKYSTGLCRLDVFDWHEYFQSLLESFNPDLVVISLGGTDTQDLIDDKGRRHIVATEGWNEHYGLRVTKLLTLAAERGVKVIWIGLPIMGQEPYNGRAQNLNAVVSQVCLKALNCYFWDATGSLLNSSGLYSTFLTDQDGKSVRVRQKDAIHLTEAGGKMMLDDFLAGTNGQLFFGNEIPNFAHAQLFPQNPDVTYAQPKTAENQSRIQRVDNTAQAGPLLAPSDGTSLPPAAGSPDSSSNSSSPRIIQTYVNDRAQKPIQAQKPINPPLNTASNAASNELKGSPLETKPWLITETVLISPVRGNTTYLTITPELTSEDPRLPAVILLHGAEGNHKYFTNNLGSDLSDMAKRLKLIIIMPDGGPFGWYLDSPIRDESQIETYLINELLPDALSRFPIDPNKIAISGISMGGHGALSLALKYPGRFKAISSISGVIDLISHSSDSPLDKYLRLSEVLGPPVSGGVNWRGHSTYHLTRNAPGRLIGVPIKLSVGLNDKLCLAENRQYDRLLTELNLEHEYSERSGGHDWDLFRAEFSSHLEFLAEKLSLISSQK